MGQSDSFTLSHPQASAKSSYRRALFQAERRRVHGGYLGRRAAVAKGKRLKRIPVSVVNEVLAGLDAILR